MKKYNIESLKEIVERVNYIRDTYSNVKLMSRKNQEKTLELLNKKYDLNFRYEDVWSQIDQEWKRLELDVAFQNWKDVD